MDMLNLLPLLLALAAAPGEPAAPASTPAATSTAVVAAPVPSAAAAPVPSGAPSEAAAVAAAPAGGTLFEQAAAYRGSGNVVTKPWMTEPLLLDFLLIGAVMFGLGMIGFLSRRNMIVMFLSAEMMLQGVGLNFVAFSWFHGNWNGQIFVIFIITVAACEAAISLALVMMLYHRSGSLDMVFWQQARESGVPAFVDQETPADDLQLHTELPHLTPAGVQPRPSDQEAELRDSHV